MAQDDIRSRALEALKRFMPSTEAAEIISDALNEMRTPEEIRDAERREGPSNQETRDAWLWVNNTPEWHFPALSIAKRMRYAADHEVGDALKDWFTERTDADDMPADAFVQDIYPMLRDIGSLWRVDWEDIAKSYLSDIERGCWHVGRNIASYLPESDVQCFATRESAVEALRGEMEEYADRDDEIHDGLAPSVPADFPVQPLLSWSANDPRVMQCGECGRAWDDTISTSLTPVPAGRCPFEYFHSELGTMRAAVDSILADAETDRTPRGEHDGVSHLVSDNDDRPISFWAQYVPAGDCDHSECEHDEDELERAE